MTPLAHRIARDTTRPKTQREHPDWMADVIRDIHCFEMTEVRDLIIDLFLLCFESDAALDLSRDQFNFLPAPRTWIEFRKFNGARCAYLITDEGQFVSVEEGIDGFLTVTDCKYWFLEGGGLQISVPKEAVEHLGGDAITYMCYFARAALALINSPRLIGRKQHMPHRGLERKLANAKGLVGKFPLHAWTELKLSVSDIGKRADGTEFEAHYTGEKCLHFCRAHLRIRNGRLERVSAHWRGNPALGIKRTRYKLAA